MHGVRPVTGMLFDEPGPRARRRIRTWSAVVVLLAAALLVAGALGLERARQFEGEIWSVLLQRDLLLLLLGGAGATARVAVVALALSLLSGVVIAAGLLARERWVRWALGAWVEVFRGLPLLLLIFFLYLGGPALGVPVSTFWALCGAIVLYNSAVIAEIVRAGVAAVPAGQAEAALAIGMGHTETLFVIQMPQAVRLMLPALVSQFVVLLKETSLGFIIGYTELMRDGRSAIEFLGGEYSLPVYTLLAVIYIAINTLLSKVAAWLERRNGRPARQTPGKAGGADAAAT